MLMLFIVKINGLNFISSTFEKISIDGCFDLRYIEATSTRSILIMPILYNKTIISH